MNLHAHLSTYSVSAGPRPEVAELKPSLIRDLANGQIGNPDVLPFWFGESDTPTPEFIKEAAIRSIQNGETCYSQNLGRPYLVSQLSTYLTNLHGCDVGTDRIAVVTAGISGLMLAAQAILSPGDKVVGIAPLWPNVLQIPEILAAHVTRVPLGVSNGKWTLDLDGLLTALTPDTRVLIVNSPSNPTGWMIEEEQVDAILAHCRRHGIWIVSDDVYQRLPHDKAINCAPSFLSRYHEGDRIISVNSFSKAWLMTGFRIGWIVAPPAVVADMTKLIEFNTCCIFEPVQRAAEVALLDGEPVVAGLRAHLRQTRPFLKSALDSVPGIDIPESGGGMYTYFRIAGVEDTLGFARRLVSETGLGLAPGEAFGPEGRGWLRWCHASAQHKIAEGVDRLKGFLEKTRKGV